MNFIKISHHSYLYLILTSDDCNFHNVLRHTSQDLNNIKKYKHKIYKDNNTQHSKLSQTILVN